MQGKGIFFAKFIIVKPAKVRIIKNNRTPHTSQRCAPRGDILFCGEIYMSEVKQAKTYEEQLSILRSRGCIIDDEGDCMDKLSSMSSDSLS